MRIALIAHHTAPIAAPFIGGVESHTWYLARWLARRGHAVTLFALPGSSVPGVAVRPLGVDAVTFSSDARADVSASPDAFLGAHHAYLAVMAELAEHCPYDVVHVNTLHYLPVAMASSLPVKPLLTLHCPPTPWLESALAVAGASNRGLPLHVAAVSQALVGSWAHAVPTDDVVLNGVDLDAWREGPGGPDCVWAGRIVPEKAPHLAIDAARAAGLAVQLAGPVIDQAYWAAEVEPRLGPGATYVGHLDHLELARLVGRSCVSIQSPVWDEPFGLSAAESIACATPVAAFRRGGLPEVVGADSGVLAERDDVDDLARAITAAARLDRGGVRADGEARLSVDAMGRAYEWLYHQLAARRVPEPRRATSGPGREATRPVPTMAERARAAGLSSAAA